MRQPEHLIFVCQNLRGDADPRGSCMARGGQELLSQLKRRRAEQGLKKRLRVMGASCLGACESGITALVVGREGPVFYGRLDAASADALIDECVLGEGPGPELRRHRLPASDLLDLTALEGRADGVDEAEVDDEIGAGAQDSGRGQGEAT